MQNDNATIAVFANHEAADAAVKKLANNGFEMKNLSVVGKGYHTEEKVVGFYNVGDRVKFWGSRGAFWGGLWGLFFGGLFVTVPVLGPVVILGYLAAIIFSTVESAVIVGGISALGAALFSLGVPDNSVIQYEDDIKVDGYLVMAHGTEQEVSRARNILNDMMPKRLDTYQSKKEERTIQSGNKAVA